MNLQLSTSCGLFLIQGEIILAMIIFFLLNNQIIARGKTASHLQKRAKYIKYALDRRIGAYILLISKSMPVHLSASESDVTDLFILRASAKQLSK